MLHLGIRSVLHIQDLTLERINTKELALLLAQTGQCHCLCRISLCQNQRALGRVLRARHDCIVQLGNARDPRLLLTVRLGILLGILGRLSLQQLWHNCQLGHHLLQRIVRQLEARPKRSGLGGQRLLGLACETRVLNHRGHKHRKVVTHHTRLDLDLLLGLQVLHDMGNHLICHAVHMRTAL